VYRFGDCLVDPARREVRREGELVPLEPQAFDLLVHLIEHRHEVVANRDLLDGVWGHTFVSPSAITTRIKEIRRALGDDGTRQHTIRNVRGRGYRFVADVAGGVDVARGSESLFGRDRDLASLVERLGNGRLVTITGPGGVGKSTLATETLQRTAAAHPDGAHLVELASVERPAQVLPAVARTLGVVLDPDAPDRAIATIGRLDALVVVDNCEHVVDEVARIVERAIRTPGGAVRILATSQVRLGVPGEHVVTLTPLDHDGALRLFEARARAIRGEWNAHEVGVERVRAVVDHLDRLPLTIEMAAARLGSMTFDDLEAAIVEGGGWPVQMTHRTPSQRHRSLTSLVDWSVDLLSDEHHRIFEDSSVFADAVPMSDAVAVLGPDSPDTVVVALTELVDRSLLSVDLAGPTARYRMLESVKRVARRRLDESGRSADLHRRHAVAVCDAVATIDLDLRTEGEPAARRRFDSILTEVRQAHRWSAEFEPDLAERLAAGLHLPAYGRLWSEPAIWSTEFVARAGADTGDLPASRLLIAGTDVNAGQLDAARAALEAVLATSADERISAIAREIMSDRCLYAGELDECRVHVDELDRIGRELDDPHMVALAATNASLSRTFAGDTGGARARLDAVRRDDLAPSSRAWLAYALGEACSSEGDHAGAIAAYGDAIELAASVDNPFVVSVALSSTAAEHARAGVPSTALEVYLSCLGLLRRHGNTVHAVTTLRNLVALLAALGQDADAVIIATAVTAPDLRPTFGPESEELAGVVDEVRGRAGSSRFDEWAATGRGLDVAETILYAASAVAALLDGELVQPSDDPHTIHKLRRSSSGSVAT
jgi:predicted ATPase/DNA-binding winged helix-turn-helix (wHTH) protein